MEIEYGRCPCQDRKSLVRQASYQVVIASMHLRKGLFDQHRPDIIGQSWFGESQGFIFFERKEIVYLHHYFNSQLIHPQYKAMVVVQDLGDEDILDAGRELSDGREGGNEIAVS